MSQHHSDYEVVQAVFCGLQFGSIMMWNLCQSIPGHPYGSTVSTATLAKHHLRPPEDEVDRAVREILASDDPTIDPMLKLALQEVQTPGSIQIDWTPMELEDNPEADFISQALHDDVKLPPDLLVPVSMLGSTDLELEVWLRHWFLERKGREPDDDFVDWCLDRMRKGAAILMTHQPSTPN